MFQETKQRFKTEILIFNTDREFIQRARDVVGCGAVYLRKRQPSNYMRRRDLYTFIVSGFHRVGWLLDQIHPYLVIKRRRAEIILLASRLIVAHRSYHTPNDSAIRELVAEFRRVGPRRET